MVSREGPKILGGGGAMNSNDALTNELCLMIELIDVCNYTVEKPFMLSMRTWKTFLMVEICVFCVFMV